MYEVYKLLMPTLQMLIANLKMIALQLNLNFSGGNYNGSCSANVSKKSPKTGLFLYF